MNTKIRYLVLDRTNTPVSPSKMGLKLDTVQSSGSPSFLDEEAAKKFATLCAQRNIGENYYVAKVLGGITANHSLDAALAKSADAVAPTKWVPTAADGTEA